MYIFESCFYFFNTETVTVHIMAGKTYEETIK